MILIKMKWSNGSTFIYLDHQGHLACDPKHKREKLNLFWKLFLEYPVWICRLQRCMRRQTPKRLYLNFLIALVDWVSPWLMTDGSSGWGWFFLKLLAPTSHQKWGNYGADSSAHKQVEVSPNCCPTFHILRDFKVGKRELVCMAASGTKTPATGFRFIQNRLNNTTRIDKLKT